jgi:exodeoxyribonuclease VII large subunit
VARAIYASSIPVISAVGHEPDVTISDYVADRRASTPSNAAEIAVPDWHEMQDALQSYEIRRRQAMEKSLKSLSQRLDALKNKRVLTDPGVYLDNRRMDMDRARDRLLAAAERQLAAKRQSFVKLGAALDAMSPLRVLSRGYTVSSDREGKVLKSVRDLRAGQEISVRFSDGLADCRVESITEGE